MCNSTDRRAGTYTYLPRGIATRLADDGIDRQTRREVTCMNHDVLPCPGLKAEARHRLLGLGWQRILRIKNIFSGVINVRSVRCTPCKRPARLVTGRPAAFEAPACASAKQVSGQCHRPEMIRSKAKVPRITLLLSFSCVTIADSESCK